LPPENYNLINSTMKRKILFLSVALMALILAGCTRKDIQVQSPEEPLSLKSAKIQNDYEVVPNEVLVKFRTGVAESAKVTAFENTGGKQKENIKIKKSVQQGDMDELTLLTVSGSLNDAIAKLKANPDVEYAEPNYIYHHFATSNDTYYTNGSLWGMYGDASPLKTNPYGSQAGEAWAAGHTGSAAVYIGIIDEGYMYTHTDLAANAGKNPGEIAGNRIDDDQNGYVDDVYGWDFDGNNNTVFDGINDDHGTHVAGTIGAVGGNKTGVAGVCWTVKILNAKFLGTNGGTTANAIKAIDYFTGLKLKGVNIVATNNSWGGGGFSQAMQDAIERANTAGILFIAAAGNGGADQIGDNNNLIPNYPSNYPNDNVIAVASITSKGALSSFSNYGSTTVDLGAPGSGIYSTVPVKSGKNVVSGYASYSGTSMATPHVTGAAALYASTHTGFTAPQIKAAILGSAVPTPSLSGKCVTGGRLNVSGF